MKYIRDIKIEELPGKYVIGTSISSSAEGERKWIAKFISVKPIIPGLKAEAEIEIVWSEVVELEVSTIAKYLLGLDDCRIIYDDLAQAKVIAMVE